MNARDEMKQMRDWLRNQVRMINKDPHLKHAHGRISARIVKWKANEHRVLVCVRDLSKPETPYNTEFCRWIWSYTWSGEDSRFWKWDVFKELNDVLVKMRS